jgi:hypothetical protein
MPLAPFSLAPATAAHLFLVMAPSVLIGPPQSLPSLHLAKVSQF